MKKNKKAKRAEKRRLVLTKRHMKNTPANEGNFARANGSAQFLKADNTATAVRTPLSKRMLAVILAVVFVLTVVPTSVFFHLRGKADEADIGPATVSVRVDGDTSYPAVQIAAGKIKNNITNVTVDGLPDGAEFIKAIMKDGDTETEIQTVGSLEGDTFYGIYEDADTGTKLANGQDIYLVYGMKYWITEADKDETKGTYLIDAHYDDAKQKYYVWNNEDINIKKITPAAGYYADTVSFTAGSVSDALSIENNAVTISAADIKGDVTIINPFKAVSKYTITDASYAKGIGNGGIAHTIGKSTISSSEYNGSYFRTRYMPEAVAPGTEETTFYLYSNSSSGGSNYILNMLRINGQDFEVSNLDDVAISDVKIDDGTETGTLVSVEYVGTNMGMYWLDNNPNPGLFQSHDRDYNWTRSGSNYVASASANKNRTVYKVTVKNIGTNLKVEYNFKEKTKSEIIIKGLRGITQTGHAREDTGTLAYNYFLESSTSNVYSAYYNQTLGVPSANLYLYRVKDGYNPYTVSSDVYYVDDDMNTVTHNTNAVLSGGAVGLPEEAIVNATAGITSNGDSSWTKFNTSYRHWGGHSQQVVSVINDSDTHDGIDFIGNVTGNPYLLTSVGMDFTPTWYGLALQQNASKNQQLYLNATPYDFHLELDLDGGTMDNADYSASISGHEGYMVEKAKHTVEEDPTLYLPETEPTKNDSVFEGWQLQRWSEKDSAYVDVTPAEIYRKADAISIEKALGLVHGKTDDQYIRLKARWETVSSTSSLTKVSIDIYKQVPGGTSGATQVDGKYYSLIHHDVETAPSRETSVLLNYYTPSPSDNYVMKSGTYENNEGETVKYTKRSTKTVPLANGSATIPESNQLRVYYDYKTVNMSVSKIVKGKTAKKSFPITITLSPDPNLPEIDLDEALGMIQVSDSKTLTKGDGVLTLSADYKKGDTISFNGVPYGWTYTVTETTEETDDFTVEYSPAQSSKLTSDTEVQVINRGNNPGIETNKTLTSNGDDTYKINLESYATGETLQEELKVGVPVDFAIVVDQSESMETTDVGTIHLSTGNKSWTVPAAANGSYYYLDPADGNYYLVQNETGTIYRQQSYSARNLNDDLLNSSTSWSLTDHIKTNGSGYYVYDSEDDEFYYLYFIENGFDKIGSYSVRFFYVQDTRITADNASSYAATAKGFYDAQTKVKPVTVNGNLKVNYSRSFLSGGLGSVSSNSLYLDVPVYKATTGANRLYYVKDGQKVYIGKKIKQTGQEAYYGKLYTKRDVSRMEALQDSVKQFVGTVAENAYETGVDHRVALIGFASNETPIYAGWDASKANGSNGIYEYLNTGLFVDGTFINYEEVQDTLTRATTQYTNAVYYINYGGTYVPACYDEDSGKWFCVKDGTYITPAWYKNSSWTYYNAYRSRTETLNNSASDGYQYRNGYPKVYRMWEPSYAPLYDNNGRNYYEGALVSANQADSSNINGELETEIDMFKAQGYTYTSYGISMANNIFKYNNGTYLDDEGNAKQRKRVIIVFSDGEPGNYDGYLESVANEALADSSISKSMDEYGATVYTVYLYGSAERSTVAEQFMKELSSDYNIETTNVYASDLDINKTYYYTENGKTYSVTTGVNNLYLWSENGEGGYNYYNATSPSSYYIDAAKTAKATKFEVGHHYWSSGGVEYVYDYKWYNSNGKIREPMIDENDPDKDASMYRHYQFFSVSDPISLGTSQYAYTAASADNLAEIFEQISKSMEMSATAVSLGVDNAYMRDVVTNNFNIPMKNNKVDSDYVKAYTVDGSIDENGELVWDEKVPFSEAQFELTVNEDGTKYVDVKNFDYGANYIANGHPGKKMLVEIDGMTLVEGKTGTLYSNKDDSGIYKVNEDETSTMVADFPMPSPVAVNPLKAQVKLTIDGTYANRSQTFPVTFTLTKSDGTPYSGKFGDYTFSSTGELKTNMADGNIKEFENIPPKAKLTVTVTDTEDASQNYTYVLKDLDKETYGETNVRTGTYDVVMSDTEGATADDTREIEVKVTDNRRKFTVQNRTVPIGDNGDMADRSKEFPIELALYDADGSAVHSTITFLDTNGRDITFENGKLTVNLADGQNRSFYVPNGYSVKVSDAEDATPYETSFEATEGTVAIETDNAKATMSGTDGAITIIHGLNAPVPTGVVENDHHFNALIWAIAGMLSLAAGGAYMYFRRRRKSEV